MMNGGQPIDPGLIQALASVGQNEPAQQKLALQSQMANQMRQGAPMPKDNNMAGKVVVRNSPFAYAANVVGNVLGNNQQQKVLSQMQEQANQLRDVKGKFMTALNASQNPQNVHPDSQGQAQVGVGGAMQAEENQTGGNYGGGPEDL